MVINKEARDALVLTPKETSLYNCALVDALGNNYTILSSYGNVSRDLSSVGDMYGTPIQMEDYSSNPTQLTFTNFVYFPFYFELSDSEDTFTNFKNLNYIFDKASAPLLTFNSLNFGARSSISVFNTFRNDFVDFT